MGRYINTESPGKDRTRLSRAVVLALRELMSQTEPNETSRDLAAFIALALHEIHATVETSVAAWEKKGYWVKADRFRLEWEWAGLLGNKMKAAVLEEDWVAVAVTAAQVAQRLMKVTLPTRHRLGTPWTGAYALLKASDNSHARAASN